VQRYKGNTLKQCCVYELQYLILNKRFTTTSGCGDTAAAPAFCPVPDVFICSAVDSWCQKRMADDQELALKELKLDISRLPHLCILRRSGTTTRLKTSPPTTLWRTAPLVPKALNTYSAVLERQSSK
jgi:hypothetical protein